MTYYNLWPGNEGGVEKTNFNENVKGQYNETVTPLDKIQNTDITGSEEKAPDGIVQLKTNVGIDKMVT